MSKSLRAEISTLSILAWPIVAGQISQMLFGFTDTLIIGHLGTVELAASAFGNSVFVIFLIFGIDLEDLLFFFWGSMRSLPPNITGQVNQH